MKKIIVWRKVLSFFMAAILSLSAITFPVVASEPENGADESIVALEVSDNKILLAPKQMYSSNSAEIEKTEGDLSLQALKEYIREELVKCTSSINISKFNFEYSAENQQLLVDWIWDQMPEAFHVNYLSVTSRNNFFYTIEPAYNFSAGEYAVMHDACVKTADKLLDGIKGNDSLSDLEKALLIHDRIAVWCEYDYDNFLQGTLPKESYTMYGVLANQVAVCQGYAETYMYLLSLVGIESSVCSSQALNHAWNIVTINGKKYYVDVTFDDPVRDITGRVNHTNFMLSSGALYANDHMANDYDMTLNDTTYDNYFWQSSETAFQLVGDDIYYIDSENETINRYDDRQSLYSVSDVWKTTGGGWWVGNFSRLSSDGNTLFFSSSEAVYSFDPVLKIAEKVFEPDLSAGECFSIYGFKYEDKYFICDLYNTPNYDAETKYLYQAKIYYDSIKPSVSIYADANGPAEVQNIKLEFIEDTAVKGYYWGMSSDYTENSFIETSEMSLMIQVTAEGTYYIVVMDEYGNLSDTYYVTFNKISLDGNGGSLENEYLITHNGNSFTLPLAEKQGYVCTGWALDAEAESALYERGSEFTVTEDILLYAVWAEAVLADVNADGKVNMADVVALRRYLVNSEVYPLSAENVADVTGDGKINMADVVALRRYLVNAELYPIG